MSDGRREFERLTCIGRGGFGEVYRATWRRPEGLSLEVALKVLRSDVDPSGQAAARMRDEGRLLSSLRHPNIVSVHDMVRIRGRAALVTEYVEGEDLTSIFAAAEALPLRPLVEIIHQVTVAMEAAWLCAPEPGTPGLVHRDIKPSNIRVGKHGQVKLLDFGLARYDSHTREAHTRTGDLIGTTPYMAPERFLRGNDGLSSDVFSLGAVLYEGLTGVRWYGELSLPRILGVIGAAPAYEKHMAERMGRLPEDLPDRLRRLLNDMLQYDVGTRPDLEHLVRETEWLSDRLPAPGLPRWCKSRTWSEAVEMEGALSGQTVAEEATDVSLPSQQPRRRRPRWNPLDVLMLVGVVGGAVVSLWPDAPSPESSDVAAVVEVDVPPPEEVVEEPGLEAAERPDATPSNEPAPSRPVVQRSAPAPTSAPKPPPAPASMPSVSKPTGASTGPAATQQAMVQLDSTTDVLVSLDGPEGTVMMVPGRSRRLASGRYTVEARFGDRIDRSLQIDLRPQTPLTLLCSARFERCRVSEGMSPPIR